LIKKKKVLQARKGEELMTEISFLGELIISKMTSKVIFVNTI